MPNLASTSLRHSNAFLHGYIDEEIYMKPILGHAEERSGKVRKLKRSLSGLTYGT